MNSNIISFTNSTIKYHILIYYNILHYILCYIYNIPKFGINETTVPITLNVFILSYKLYLFVYLAYNLILCYKNTYV